MDQMQGLQEITEQQSAKSQELSKGTEEYEDLRILEAENLARRPPPAPHEEEAGQGVDDFPPLDENDEDMLEQSSKRQKSVPVFSSVRFVKASAIALIRRNGNRSPKKRAQERVFFFFKKLQ